ncbi:general secretion pathway protein H [Desulfurispirillum indicum S5]|uniref:Type II secretion system protein H n=1 Tax=Desulfurispirillum indicum (strain ATCC BAA-1389 / DSM 22839 / S5) TaxID=653733 RepID=E6W4T7_DESIS|nr:general secretion pathway protein H [Desulfurispirillum indicum S5]
MRLSATGISDSGLSVKGFTLIEILVVLVIIGILASVTVMTMGQSSGQRELEREARRLHAVLKMAADEAVYNGRELGFATDFGGYGFFLYDPAEARWVALEEGPLRQHELRSEIRLHLEQEHRPVLPGAVKLSDSDPVPTVLLLSSGEVSPFTLVVEWHASSTTLPHYRLSTDGIQDITFAQYP